MSLGYDVSFQYKLRKTWSPLFMIAIIIILFGTSAGYGHQFASQTSTKTLQDLHLSEQDYQLLKSQLIEIPKFPVKAENFRGIPVNGDLPDLLSFKNHFILLNFWATWCVPCLKELPDMEKLHQETREQGVVVLAVAMGEDKQTVEKFLKKHHFSFPIMADPDGEISQLYGINRLPITYLINHDNIVVGRAIGPREWSNSTFLKFFQSQTKK